MNIGSETRRVSDLWRTVLTGPLRFLGPVVGYVFLYPLLLSSTTLSVVGVWSLLTVVGSVALLCDVGFTQLITRDLSSADSAVYQEALTDYEAVQRLFSMIAVVLIVAITAVFTMQFAIVERIYPATGIALAAGLTATGAALQLKSRVTAALLSAHNDNAWVQLTASWTNVITFLPAIAGTLWGFPLEGYGVGFALCGAANFVAIKNRARPKEVASGGSLSLRLLMQRIIRLGLRGKHFYAIGAGLLIRAPISRFAIAAVAGLEAVGIFDIAMRITQLARDSIAIGFHALFPTFARLSDAKRRAETLHLVTLSLLVLLPLGSASLGALLIFGRNVLTIWLGTWPDDLWLAIKVLALWQFLTLLNVPYWFLLQATGNERAAAFSIWAHTVLILVTLAPLPLFSASAFSTYWALSSAATQIGIYATVQIKLAALRPTMFTVPVMSALCFSILGLGAAWTADSLGPSSTPDYWMAIGLFAVAALLLQALLLGAVLHHVRRRAVL